MRVSPQVIVKVSQSPVFELQIPLPSKDLAEHLQDRRKLNLIGADNALHLDEVNLRVLSLIFWNETCPVVEDQIKL